MGVGDAVYLGFKSLSMTACFSCLKLSATVAGVFFEMGRNWDIFYFRHKKSPSIIRKDLILKVFDGGSCAIRTRDHRIKSSSLIYIKQLHTIYNSL